MTRVAVFTGSRSEYGLLHSIIRAMADDPAFVTVLIISGSHLHGDFGYTVDEIDKTGVNDIREIDTEGSLFSQFASLVEQGGKLLGELNPDVILLAGDRYETFSMAVAAYYGNVPIAHMFGGDLSQGGHLDDSVRHSLTKLAHIHLVTNEDSRKRVLGLGEENWRVTNVGSPVLDNIAKGEIASADEVVAKLGVDPEQPLVLFTQHPVTTEISQAYDQVSRSLEALYEVGYQTVITYPNSDPGSESIIEAIREYVKAPQFRIVKSLGWRLYLGCMRMASCVVGNSSSGLMETPFFRVPCVNIGSRQEGRLRAENVIDVPYDKESIKQAVLKAVTDAGFISVAANCSNPYGSGEASAGVLKILAGLPDRAVLLRKKITF